jgi:hypothetical protein
MPAGAGISTQSYGHTGQYWHGGLTDPHQNLLIDSPTGCIHGKGNNL